MKIKTVNNYYTDENTYIVYDENTKNGIVIDPGYKCDGILKAAQDDGVNIKYVLITHCHYDHISDMEQTRTLICRIRDLVMNCRLKSLILF